MRRRFTMGKVIGRKSATLTTVAFILGVSIVAAAQGSVLVAADGPEHIEAGQASTTWNSTGS